MRRINLPVGLFIFFGVLIGLLIGVREPLVVLKIFEYAFSFYCVFFIFALFCK